MLKEARDDGDDDDDDVVLVSPFDGVGEGKGGRGGRRRERGGYEGKRRRVGLEAWVRFHPEKEEQRKKTQDAKVGGDGGGYKVEWKK